MNAGINIKVEDSKPYFKLKNGAITFTVDTGIINNNLETRRTVYLCG